MDAHLTATSGEWDGLRCALMSFVLLTYRVPNRRTDPARLLAQVRRRLGDWAIEGR